MTEFKKPAIIVGIGVTGENIAFLAEPNEKYARNEIFSYFSDECDKLTVITLAANFSSPSERNFVVNHILDKIEDNTSSEYLENSYEITKSLY